MIGDDRHDEIRESLPAFFLGGLDPDEEVTVREHLRGCEECRRELASYEPLRDALNLAADDAPLPAGARERLLERTSSVRALPTSRPDPLPSVRRPSHLSWSLAAASLLVAALLGGVLLQQNRQLSGEVAEQQKTISSVVDLMERADLQVEDLSTGGSEARARVYAAREGDVGMFVFDKLPRLPEGEVYQLWVGETEGLEEDAGTFVATDAEKGSYHKLLSPPGGFDQYGHVGITASPEGGLQTPPPPSDQSWLVRSELPEYMQANQKAIRDASQDAGRG